MTNNAASETKLRGALLGSFLDEHHGRIAEHYAHAIEKHPYFCDRLEVACEMTEPFLKKKRIDTLKGFLAVLRNDIETEKRCGILHWQTLLDCEKMEVAESLAKGDTAHAVDELYDCVAVLLRTIDVLEGRQKLGKPETKGETK